jgi:uncharacterized membrane protein YphA (DoxX/SURF4 family)
MQQLRNYGRIFYGLGTAGIGIQHFIYPGFRPVILPLPPETTAGINFLAYATGAIIALAGLYIALAKNVKTIALFLGLFFLLFCLLGHLPNRLANQPGNLGAWTDALKCLTLAGGSFVVSRLYPDSRSNGFISFLEKISAYGKYFFALLLVIFGIDHFIYLDFVKTLVPDWIPGHEFWTRLGGVALIGAGLAIFINFKPRSISLLLAVMLLIWLIVLHIPRAFAAPATDYGNEWTSVFECLAFAGIALLYPLDKLETFAKGMVVGSGVVGGS